MSTAKRIRRFVQVMTSITADSPLREPASNAMMSHHFTSYNRHSQHPFFISVHKSRRRVG